MTPGSFDVKTCRELVGEVRAQSIERTAREHAERGVDEPPAVDAAAPYQAQLLQVMERTIYVAQRDARLRRIGRLQGAR